MSLRIALAFGISPLVPAFVAALVSGAGSGTPLAIPVGMMFYAPFAYFFAIALGVPAYLALRRAAFLTWRTVLSAGFVLGAASGAMLPLLLGADPDRVFVGEAVAGNSLLVLLFALSGTLAAGAFWVIGLRARGGIPPS